MRIIPNEKVFFEKFSVGDVFEYNGALFMKIEPAFISDEECNSVVISTASWAPWILGSLHFFGDKTSLSKVQAAIKRD